MVQPEYRRMDPLTTNAANKSNSFSAGGRHILLDEYFSMQQSFEEITAQIPLASGLDAQRLMEHERLYRRKLMALRDQYIAGVPFLPLSRCPFTSEIMLHSIDNYGLDGLWWDYEYAARPQSPLLKTYVALTGAVKLDSKVRWAPFICRPGPEVPYVIPRLLNLPTIMAVLSSLKIGDNQGYAITYYGSPPPQKVPRVNTWGSDTYIFLDENGKSCWDSEPESQSDYDFDIEAWIKNGLLLWIAPGDAGLVLRNDTAGCPYLGLQGIKKNQVIYKGKIS